MKKKNFFKKICTKTKNILHLQPLLKKQAFFEITAEIAQLVEHDLAKVGVAGSSPVFRSQRNFNISNSKFPKF